MKIDHFHFWSNSSSYSPVVIVTRPNPWEAEWTGRGCSKDKVHEAFKCLSNWMSADAWFHHVTRQKYIYIYFIFSTYLFAFSRNAELIQYEDMWSTSMWYISRSAVLQMFATICRDFQGSVWPPIALTKIHLTHPSRGEYINARHYKSVSNYCQEPTNHGN